VGDRNSDRSGGGVLAPPHEWRRGAHDRWTKRQSVLAHLPARNWRHICGLGHSLLWWSPSPQLKQAATLGQPAAKWPDPPQLWQRDWTSAFFAVRQSRHLLGGLRSFLSAKNCCSATVHSKPFEHPAHVSVLSANSVGAAEAVACAPPSADFAFFSAWSFFSGAAFRFLPFLAVSFASGAGAGAALGDALGDAFGDAFGGACGAAFGDALGDAFGDACGAALGDAFVDGALGVVAATASAAAAAVTFTFLEETFFTIG